MGRKGGLQNTAESAQSGPNVVGKWVAHVLKFKNHEEKIINRRGPLEISMNLGLRASRIGWSNCMWLREQNAIPKIRVFLVFFGRKGDGVFLGQNGPKKGGYLRGKGPGEDRGLANW